MSTPLSDRSAVEALVRKYLLHAAHDRFDSLGATPADHLAAFETWRRKCNKIHASEQRV